MLTIELYLVKALYMLSPKALYFWWVIIYILEIIYILATLKYKLFQVYILSRNLITNKKISYVQSVAILSKIMHKICITKMMVIPKACIFAV